MSQILVRLHFILIKTPLPGDTSLVWLLRQDLPEDDLRVRTVESNIECAWHGGGVEPCVCVSQAAPPYTSLITSAATQHAHYALECGHNLMIDAVRRKTVGNT